MPLLAHPESPLYAYKTLKQKDIEVVLPATPGEPVRLLVYGALVDIEAYPEDGVWYARYPDYARSVKRYADADAFAAGFRQEYNQRLGAMRKHTLKDRRLTYDLAQFGDALSEESRNAIEYAKSGPHSELEYHRPYLQGFGVKQSLVHPYRELDLSRKRFSYKQDETLRVLYDGHVIGCHEPNDTPDVYVDVTWQDVNAARQNALMQLDNYTDHIHREHNALDAIFAFTRTPKRR